MGVLCSLGSSPGTSTTVIAVPAIQNTTLKGLLPAVLQLLSRQWQVMSRRRADVASGVQDHNLQDSSEGVPLGHSALSPALTGPRALWKL